MFPLKDVIKGNRPEFENNH